MIAIATIGERIRKYRKLNGYTMEQLGEKIGTQKGTVNNWEKNRNNPDRKNSLLVAKALDIPVEFLIYGYPTEHATSVLQKNGYEIDKDFLKYIEAEYEHGLEYSGYRSEEALLNEYKDFNENSKSTIQEENIGIYLYLGWKETNNSHLLTAMEYYTERFGISPEEVFKNSLPYESDGISAIDEFDVWTDDDDFNSPTK